MQAFAQLLGVIACHHCSDPIGCADQADVIDGPIARGNRLAPPQPWNRRGHSPPPLLEELSHELLSLLDPEQRAAGVSVWCV